MVRHEDMHFLIDSAPPKEVKSLLRCLTQLTACSLEELRVRMLDEWQVRAQRSLSNSTRRLVDLGLARKERTDAGKPGYALTALGAKVRNVLDLDPDLYADLMHYLHYDGYVASPSARKLFWSYQHCCDLAWQSRRVPPVSQIVGALQAQIAAEFPSAYLSKVGGNFNAGGVSAWKAWLMELHCPPVTSRDAHVVLRVRSDFQLALLALDHVYRARGYRYADPVLLDDGLLDEAARVFFLDPACCRELIDLAARVTRSVSLGATFAGTSVTLLGPYSVEDV